MYPPYVHGRTHTHTLTCYFEFFSHLLQSHTSTLHHHAIFQIALKLRADGQERNDKNKLLRYIHVNY